jgi:hypothetical protein
MNLPQIRFFNSSNRLITLIQRWSFLFFISISMQVSAQLRVNNSNPHYLQYKNKPVILITSAEHYGCLVNTAFDYITYLDALRANGMNLTRVFAGPMTERRDDIGWMHYNNTLAPKPGKLLVPWARSKIAGYYNGGNKFDLDTWDENYFKRLKDLLIQAEKRGIIIELTLFGNQYKDSLWMNCPLYPMNNIRQEGPSGTNSFLLFQTMKDAALVKRQEAFVTKIVAELNSFDNLYYEICNEPYNEQKDSAAVDAWHHHMIQYIRQQESSLSKKHLVAINESVPDNPAVSVINYHYVYVVRRPSFDSLYQLNKIIGLDETLGSLIDADINDVRTEAWDHILKGGGVYNNLNWEYTPANPAGTDSARLIRSYLKTLQQFMQTFDYVRMSPVAYPLNNSDSNYFVRILAEKGKQYAIYIHHSKPRGKESIWGYDAVVKKFNDSISIDMPAGNYQLKYVNPSTGRATGSTTAFTHSGRKKIIKTPDYITDIAIQILKVKTK